MNRRIVLIVVAVVLALVGTVAVYSYAHNADERAVAEGRAVKVLIATKRVQAGTSWAEAIKTGAISTQNMPASSTPDSALHDINSGIAQGSVAQSDIAPGQVVLREAFGTAAAQTGVLAVPKGKIAVTVSLDSKADVAGFVAPRSQVVVFLTADLKGGIKIAADQSVIGGATTLTKTLLPRVQVIATSEAAPTNVDGKNGGTAGSGGSVLVTLAVTQAQAEQLILGQHVGELYLGLLTDTSRTGTTQGTDNVDKVDPAPIFVK